MEGMQLSCPNALALIMAKPKLTMVIRCPIILIKQIVVEPAISNLGH